MSNNLNLDQVAEGQDSAEVTINDQAGQLDAAMTEVLQVAVDNTNTYTLSATQLRRNFMFDIIAGSPIPTATITLEVPGSIERGIFVVLNETVYDVEVSVSGQSEPVATVASGDASTLYSDGINVRSVGGGGGGGGGGPFTSPFTVTNGSEDFVVTVTNATVTELSTDSTFFQFTTDIDGSPSGFAVSASQLAPLTDDTLVLGDASFQWNKILVGTGTSVFKGHVQLNNAKELRLFEPTGSGTNYTAFKAGAQAGDVTYTVPPADGTNTYFLQTNGSGVLAWAQAVLPTNTRSYDVGGSFGGSPTASQVVLRFIATRTINFVANFSTSQSKSRVAATGSTAFDIQKNGSSIGTMTYAAAASTATFVSSGGAAQSLAAGDKFDIVAPASPDATLADIYMTFAGTVLVTA